MQQAQQVQQFQPANKIQIILEKLSYVSGEQINGFIFLDIKEVYPNSFVNLHFVGEEYVNYQRMEGSGKHRHRRTYTEMKKLLEYNYPVFQFPTPHIQIGTYFFPFTFNLPFNLPSSFYIKFNNGELDRLGSIEYRLRAFLPTPDVKSIPELFGEEALIINNLGVYPQPLDIQIRKPATCYCCCQKGYASIHAYLEKNCFKVGEESRVMFRIDVNELKAKVKGVIVSLRQVVFFTTSANRVELDTVLVSQEKIQNVSNYQLKDGLTVPFRVPQIAIQTGKMVYPNLESRLLKNSFTLTVELDTDIANCCKENPKAVFEINVVNDSSQLKQQDLNIVDILRNNMISNPQTMPMSVFDTSERYAIVMPYVDGFFFSQFAGNAQVMSAPSLPIQIRNVGSDDYAKM